MLYFFLRLISAMVSKEESNRAVGLFLRRKLTFMSHCKCYRAFPCPYNKNKNNTIKFYKMNIDLFLPFMKKNA